MPDHASGQRIYRFDDLGWSQFEQVCEAYLATRHLGDLVWSGRADGLRTASAGTHLIVAAWVKRGLMRGKDRSLLGSWLASELPSDLPSLIVVTNFAGASDESIRKGWGRPSDRAPAGIEVIGPHELEAAIAQHPGILRAVPSLLGVRDLSPVAEQECHARSSWDFAAAAELARVFVPTRAYRRALDVIDRHHFAVLSGPPEMGKTAIARVLGLALQVDGWEVHECIRPEQIWEAFDRARAQLFVADDAFGSTEYRPDAAERWSLELPRILQAMDAQHKLVWTSRPAPLRAGLARIHREHGAERFPKPAEVSVDAAALDLEERATILLRHARAAPPDYRCVFIVKSHCEQLVEHEHFTPERMRRFVVSRLPELSLHPVLPSLAATIAREIAEPTEAMAASFRALDQPHRALLVALLDSPPGPVPERELANAIRRHAAGGLPAPVRELVDRLADHFVRPVPPESVTWVHPSWRDLVIDELVADAEARAVFLERCSIEGALLALSRGGGTTGARVRPLLRSDGDWDRLAQRLHELAPELADPEVARLLTALEDAVQSVPPAERADLVAVTETALRSLAAAWSCGHSYANLHVLDRANALWDYLDLPALDLAALVWEPPPGERYQGAVARSHSAPVPDVDWVDPENPGIVRRILSDL